VDAPGYASPAVSETAETTAYCYRHPDRETGLSCSDCGRPICTDCATFAPVGIRCPDHSGGPKGVKRVQQKAERRVASGDPTLVTKVLIGINVFLYMAMILQGASLGRPGGELYVQGALVVRAQRETGELLGLAEGEWWRLFTAAFLHASLIHLGMNMLGLWWFGSPLEATLGRARFLLLYCVSGLAGSAGALLATPNGITVGASGALFGLLGAALVLERGGIPVFGGGALGVIVLNLAFTFLIPGISIGGHIGGLIGGALCALALSRFGRGHAVYGRLGPLGIAGVVGVVALTVLVAVIQVDRVT
jgi:membrane associated rhomboid family serine protease